MRIRNILVPIDFSSHSEVALQYALQLARVHDSKLHLLHAYSVAIPLFLETAYPLPENVIETVRRGAEAQLEPIEKRVAREGLPCEAHLSPQDPATAILELAKSLPADLIVMGTRGLTGFKHVALGSVAERAVRLAPCPVLTVKAGDL